MANDLDTEESERNRGPVEPDRMDRLVARVSLAWNWAADHARVTWEWMRRQPPARLVTLAVGTIGAVLAAWMVLWLLTAMVSAVAGAVFGPDEPAPPVAPPEHQQPPSWVVAIQHAGLWDRVFTSLMSYADAAAPAAGTPGWLLLAIWGGAGAAALLGSWLSPGRRGVATTMAWWSWLAATAWVIWINTPAANPVPAAITVALGVLVGIQPWTVLLVGALVALGVMT